MTVRRDLVEAGAGCGKTESLVRRYLEALQNGRRAHDIIALTFTEEAATQMLERLRTRLIEGGQENLAQEVTEEGQISTFHSLCLRLLRPHLRELGYNPQGQLLLPSLARLLRRDFYLESLAAWPQRSVLLRNFSPSEIADLGADFFFRLREVDPESVANFYTESSVRFDAFRAHWQSYIAQNNLRPEGAWIEKFSQALADPATFPEAWVFRGLKKISDVHPDFYRAARAYKEFLEAGLYKSLQGAPAEQEYSAQLFSFLKATQAQCPKYLDYSALEAELCGRIEAGLFSPPPCRLLIVDEFQDTNREQYKILQALSQPTTEWYFVGDPKQSIYGFRGADVSLFLELRAQLERKALETNYRSDAPVLNFCNHLQAVIFAQPGPLDPPAQNLKVGRTESPSTVHAKILLRRSPKGEELFPQVLQDWRRSRELHPEDHWRQAVLFLSWRELYRFAAYLETEDVDFEISGSENFLQSPYTEIFAHFLESLDDPARDQGWLELLRWQKQDQFTSPADLRSEIERRRAELPLLDQLPFGDELGLFQKNLPVLDRRGGREWLASMERLLLELAHLGFDEKFSRRQLAQFLLKNLHKLEVASPRFRTRQGNPLRLLTVHGAKGLEFESVYLPELYERSAGRGAWALHDEAGLALDLSETETSLFFVRRKLEARQRKEAEMRRLFYVALTRAKTELALYFHEPSEKKSDKVQVAEVLNWPLPRPTLWHEVLNGYLGTDEIEAGTSAEKLLDEKTTRPSVWIYS